jgi:HD-GYP domain-containing protein (c-di-GMP phosphodiesterase class II)
VTDSGVTAAIKVPKRPGTILASLLGLLVVTALGPLLLTSRYLVSQARADLEFDQKTLQMAKTRHLSDWVAQYRQSINTAVKGLTSGLAMDAPADFRGRIARVAANDSLASAVSPPGPLIFASVVDRSGEGARAGRALSSPGLDRAIQSAFAEGLAGRSSTTPPLWNEAVRAPVLVLGEPIRIGTRVVAVVIAVATLEPILRVTRQSDEAGLLDVYVVTGDGRAVAYSRPDGPQTGEDLSEIEIVRDFKATGGRATVTMPFTLPSADGPARSMLGTVVRVADDSGWGVVAQIDEAKAYAGVDRMQRNARLVVGAVAIAALGLGTWLSGAITRPIRQLRDAAIKLSRGEFQTRVKVEANNEVGVLGDTFNVMGGRIEEAVQKISEAAETNRELFIGAIRMLANAIDAKDPYTRGHSERVAYFSSVIARGMGLSEDDVQTVHLSGLIHDVGKIGIEDRILRKPAALTDDEYEIMKQHPTKGQQILDAVPKLKALAGAGLMHHENVDGSGYPDGLKGDEIPFLGRLVSVADAFDAMTTDRPYSKAMTYEAAVARLRFLAGKKFDAQCVEAMARAVESGELTPAKARVAAVAARRDGPTVSTQLATGA